MVMIAAMRYAAAEPVEEAVGPEPARPQLTQWELPSWEEIVRTHSARVYRLAYRLTGNQHDAEDLTQEVFVRVFRSLSSYTPGTFEGWLHRITTNLFLDGARRRQRIRFEGLGDDVAQRLPGGELSPAQAWDERHLDGDIQAALQALPPDYRAAVVLCDIEGFSYEEIAATMGVKLGTVRSRIHRGRAQLRAALAHRERRAGPSPSRSESRPGVPESRPGVPEARPGGPEPRPGVPEPRPEVRQPGAAGGEP
jgi:RNA polymerase sigma-70 factor, ECF subfamily